MSYPSGFWQGRRQLLRAALPLGLLLLVLPPQVAQATSCTYREDALGQTRYQCDNGKRGTLREDALGHIKDTGTGVTWRKDALGNLKGSDGTTYRQDALGNTHSYNSKTGAKVTWREDSLGNLRASDGTVCRTDALGQNRCSGESTPPELLRAK